MPRLVLAVISFIVLCLSVGFHEFSHAFVATQLGDDLPRQQGRVTLNPLAHLDPQGTLMMVFAAIAGYGIGWGKPVQVNAYNLSPNPRVGFGIVALAGPVANIILAILAALPLRLGLAVPQLVGFILQVFIVLNITLAVFNMLPIFPLDGYNVLLGLVSAIRARWADDFYRLWSKQAALGPGLLLVVVLLGFFGIPILPRVINPPTLFLQRLILG